MAAAERWTLTWMDCVKRTWRLRALGYDARKYEEMEKAEHIHSDDRLI